MGYREDCSSTMNVMYLYLDCFSTKSSKLLKKNILEKEILNNNFIVK